MIEGQYEEVEQEDGTTQRVMTVEGYRQNLERRTGRAVWPLVVIDPYQRRAEATDATTSAETAIANQIRAMTDRYG